MFSHITMTGFPNLPYRCTCKYLYEDVIWSLINWGYWELLSSTCIYQHQYWQRVHFRTSFWNDHSEMLILTFQWGKVKEIDTMSGIKQSRTMCECLVSKMIAAWILARPSISLNCLQCNVYKKFERIQMVLCIWYLLKVYIKI